MNAMGFFPLRLPFPLHLPHGSSMAMPWPPHAEQGIAVTKEANPIWRVFLIWPWPPHAESTSSFRSRGGIPSRCTPRRLCAFGPRSPGSCRARTSSSVTDVSTRRSGALAAPAEAAAAPATKDLLKDGLESAAVPAEYLVKVSARTAEDILRAVLPVYSPHARPCRTAAAWSRQTAPHTPRISP